MTREEVKELLPIMQALAEGKAIQDKIEGLTDWCDTDEINLEYEGQKIIHRIKPESRYRPFKTQEECWNEILKHQPVGFLKSKDNEYFCLIGSVNKDNTITLAIEPNTDYSCIYLFEHYIFSDDTPFGIKED